ncbi:hypothetical protein U732_111 [Clostridium argentinense CDC 2741]|uniref:Uncharacterized protein n=2 Tax=Clostridium argentinense TaxID=29341 RepID=A0A0C1TWH0_9CLOT|nr:MULTISPECIES: hypothetical protein [Clostridium]ARC83155.1 hypothetical protein RSJ17_00455 [Clostridium argentinense]KIE45054.1 hypothetical protein U732_111 [Clostridium argentinense CDC 2741]NFF41603.1 hypothetical protein [Clostridium argentinense]NFP52303.1 hypothetical protein [Clostridium argentinense]NFP74684.1 hypothetical protein [Clostridium argentinense]
MKKEYYLKYDINMKNGCIPKGTKTIFLRSEKEGAVLYLKVIEGPYNKKNLRVYKSEAIEILE